MIEFNFDEELVEEAEATGGSFGTMDTGIYEVTILSTTEGEALVEWLGSHNYTVLYCF